MCGWWERLVRLKWESGSLECVVGLGFDKRSVSSPGLPRLIRRPQASSAPKPATRSRVFPDQHLQPVTLSFSVLLLLPPFTRTLHCSFRTVYPSLGNRGEMRARERTLHRPSYWAVAAIAALPVGLFAVTFRRPSVTPVTPRADVVRPPLPLFADGHDSQSPHFRNS
jgi:hypothetical protein